MERENTGTNTATLSGGNGSGEASRPLSAEDNKNSGPVAAERHKQVLAEIIQQNGEVLPRHLYPAYRERVDAPRTERMVRKYLHALSAREAVVLEGEGRCRVYKAPGEGSQ